MLLNNLSTDIAASWDDMHKYSPAPRHRRKMLMKILSNLTFQTCLDAGCAQGYLLHEIITKFAAEGFGCDISPIVIEQNKSKFPSCEFMVLDIENSTWPNQKQFDVVISSEVIEHIADWKNAIKHLAQMTEKYLIITVPGGKIRAIDKQVGHFRHFSGNELTSEIEKHGFSCQPIIRHGFPVHSLYKRLINGIMPDKVYDSFSGNKKYSAVQKIISSILYSAFHLNYAFQRGEQLFIIAKKNGASHT